MAQFFLTLKVAQYIKSTVNIMLQIKKEQVEFFIYRI